MILIPSRMTGLFSGVKFTAPGHLFANAEGLEFDLAESFVDAARSGDAMDWHYVAETVDGWRVRYGFNGAEIIRESMYRVCTDPGALHAIMRTGEAIAYRNRPDRWTNVRTDGYDSNAAPKVKVTASQNRTAYCRKIVAKAAGYDKVVAWKRDGYPVNHEALAVAVPNPDKRAVILADADIPAGTNNRGAGIPVYSASAVRPNRQHTGVYAGHSHNN